MKRRIAAKFDFEPHIIIVGAYIVTCCNQYASMLGVGEVTPDIIRRRLSRRSTMYFRLREYGR